MIFSARIHRGLIAGISVLIIIAVVISAIYYRKKNNSVDPRIRNARLLYEKYNTFAQDNNPDSVFQLMNKIEKIYSVPTHYRNSFETGVLFNNKAAAYISLAFSSGLSENSQDSLLELSNQSLQKSIEIYNSWLHEYEGISASQIHNLIKEEFLEGLENYTPKKQEKYLQNRVNEIEESQLETKRRLSVSYTNLGIIYRHHQYYDSAAICYKKAMDLWGRNLTAENNLNVLLGRPLKKRNILQNLFPPIKINNSNR